LSFIGFPPIPQKEAEWMGHGGLWQEEECSKAVPLQGNIEEDCF
jgi:hypothetical protein